MSSVRKSVEIEDLVSALYQAILDRKPDAVGFSHFSSLIEHGSSISSIIRQCLTSPERMAKEVVSLGHLDALPANVVELDLSPDEKQSLWDHVRSVWSELGRDDPYWAVLTADEFRIANMSQPE